MCLTVCDPTNYIAHQNSMDFSREEYWSGRPFPSPGNLLNPGIEPGPPPLQADSLPSEPPGKPKMVLISSYFVTDPPQSDPKGQRVPSARCVCAHSVTSDPLQPHGLQPSRLHCQWISQARIVERAANFSSRDLPDPGINASLLHWQAGSPPLSHLGSPSVRYGLCP